MKPIIYRKYKGKNQKLETHAQIGKAYLWKLDGSVFLCVDEDLETWTGVCIRATDNITIIKDLRHKIGRVIKCLSTFNDNWEPVDGILGIDELAIHCLKNK